MSNRQAVVELEDALRIISDDLVQAVDATRDVLPPEISEDLLDTAVQLITKARAWCLARDGD